MNPSRPTRRPARREPHRKSRREARCGGCPPPREASRLISGPTARVARMLAVAALSIALVAPAASAQDLSEVEIETIPVADGVWMLAGAGGNLGVAAGEDGVFLIDDQYAPLTGRILEAIRGLGHGDPRFLVNTHWHGDHTGGNENMGEAGALIVAHRNVRTRMGAEQVLAIMEDPVPPSPEGALPVVTFSREMTFHLNGDSVEVIHVPHAHTDGDAIIHFTRADVVHMGDTFFAGTYPFIDLDSGGDVRGILAAIDLVLDRAGPETRIIPGHGPLSTVDDLRAYRDVLREATRRIGEARDRGMSLDEVRTAGLTAEWDEEWGGGFIGPDAFVGFVYRSFERREGTRHGRHHREHHGEQHGEHRPEHMHHGEHHGEGHGEGHEARGGEDHDEHYGEGHGEQHGEHHGENGPGHGDEHPGHGGHR